MLRKGIYTCTYLLQSLNSYSKGMTFLTIGIMIYATLVNALTSTSQAFILDHQLGMFACQANPSINSLSLYNISALCDGIPHCYNGLDEDRTKLECKSNCNPSCVHGTCLKGPQCYCDCDWGGKDCNIPDINECKNSPCHNMAFCTNTLGSFYCTCLPGFSGDGFNCKDIDECSGNGKAAATTASQTTTNPLTSQSDIAELSLPETAMVTLTPNSSKFCAQNAKCFNVPGSYYCQCSFGFAGDGYLGCEDVDECASDVTNLCGSNSECKNLVGNFECNCDKGFKLSSTDNSCQDVDECEEVVDSLSNRRYCHTNSDCINAIGGYACICKDGFIGNGLVECTDVDECADPSSRLCQPPSVCHNTNGSYECLCPAGFQKKEDSCIEINQCLPGLKVEESNDCDLNSDCQLVGSSYRCVCNKGFSGNGTSCADVDECLENSALCLPGSCVNSIGAFYCSDEERRAEPKEHPLETYFNGTIVIRPKGKVQKLDDLANPDGSEFNYVTRGLEDNSRNRFSAESTITDHLNQYQGLHRTIGSNQKDFIQITCKADGIEMGIDFAKSNLSRPFNGILYVKGNFKAKKCRRLIMNNLNPFYVTTFTVKYSDCAFDRNEEANEFNTIIVMQPHLKLLTYDAKAYKVFCMYDEIEKTVSNELTVSMITPQKILKATSLSPTCKMEVLDINGKSVTFTDLGSKLQLKIWLLQVGVKYGLRAKNCVAKTLTEDWEYLLVDKDGCSTDTKLFEDFQTQRDGSISAIFSAFKFPNSVYLRFKCEVKICLGTCDTHNCDRNNGSALRFLGKRDLSNRTQNVPKGELEERVESRLMEIKDRSVGELYYYEEDENGIPSLEDSYYGSNETNSQLHPKVAIGSYNGPGDEAIRLSASQPKLTCVSRFGLLTGLSLTLLMALLGGSGLAFSVRKQLGIRNRKLLTKHVPVPDEEGTRSGLSSPISDFGSSFLSSDILDNASGSPQPSTQAERCFYNKAFSN